MCELFGGGKNQTITNQKNTQDPLTQQIRRSMLPLAYSIANQSFPGYNYKNRVAPFSQDQLSAFSKIREFSDRSQNPDYYQYAQKAAQEFGQTKPYMERIVDENGKLGKISDYMDPHLRAALDPALREISETAQLQRRGIGDQAVSSGAFGDARHGVVEAENYESEQQARGDTTGRMYSDAFNSAMGRRAHDRDAFYGAEEGRLARLMQSGIASMDMGTANDQNYLSRLMAQLGIGEKQQGHAQAIKDAHYEQFKLGTEWPFRQFDVLKSLLSGQPSANEVTTTSTSKQNNNWLMQLLGSIGGALI